MPLARVKTWNPGDVLTAADLNTEFNNVLNNPISLISNATALVAGDVLIASTDATPVLKRLAVGTASQALVVTSSSTLPTWSGPQAGSRVSGLFGSYSSQVGSFSARQYLAQTTDGRQSFQVNATSSYTINVGTSGPAAGGRDVAGVFASTFVHFYAITTGARSTAPAGIASTVPPPTGPVMPTSYSAWTYLGTCPYTSASTTLTTAYAHGSRTQLKTPASDAVLLSAGTATVATQILLSSVVPTNATRFETLGLLVQSTNVAGTIPQLFLQVDDSVTANSTTAMHFLQQTAQVAGVDSRIAAIPLSFPYLSASSQGLWYINNSSGAQSYQYLSAFTNPNGAE